ncbi:MAG: ABC transporter permease subunit [Deltaproteobacteria bacterium]|nr:ABC transporter permease subunit [Deltaproteobacteria bacterium]
MSTLCFISENMERVLYLTWEHIWIVGSSLVIAMIIGIPLGVLITRHKNLAQRVLNTANVLMTIPSIALFGIMLPILAVMGFGLGKLPAVIALVLYSQLPIIRNTYTAILNVPRRSPMPAWVWE